MKRREEEIAEGNKGTQAYSVIPDRDIVLLPFVTHLEIVVLGHLGIEKREDRVRLYLGDAYYSHCPACPRQRKTHMHTGRRSKTV
jgi:hypothetical protein